MTQHGGDELGRIVERDAAWTLDDLTCYAAQDDRRYLLGLLREARTVTVAMARMGFCSQTHHEFVAKDARDLLARLAALEAIPAHAGEEET